MRHLLRGCFVSWLFCSLALAQEYTRPELDLNAFVQNLFPVQNQDINYEDVFETLYQFYQRPLDLNSANYEDLAALYILSEAQLKSYFEYRAKAGNLVSIYELQAVPNFDLPTIYKLLPFVVVRPDKLSLSLLRNSLQGESNSYFLFRTERVLEERKGFTPPDSRSKTRYTGSPYRWFARYKTYHAKDFSFGFTLDKDAGEQFTWDPATRRYGADFFSFHLNFQNKGNWKSISLGDYQIQVGQGLILSGGFYIGKGAETVLTARRSHLGIRPYTSATEYNFFRGAAATYKLGNVEITGFYSRQRRDGNLVDGPTDDEDYISSLQTSGLHRTTSEIADKGSLLAQDFGGNILYRAPSNRFQVGVTALNTLYDKDLIRANKPYNLYEFRGKQNLLLGGHFSFLVQNFNFFGEVARSSSGGIGVVGGFLASLSKRWDVAVVGRNYDKNFHSFYANSFGENTRSINEQGIYTGVKFTPSRRWQFGAYFDYFKFPYLRYLVDKQPTDGYGYLLRASHKPQKTTEIYLQYFSEHKEKNLPERLSTKNETVANVRHSLQAGLDYAFSRTLSINSKLLYNTFGYQGFAASKGFAFVQDLNADLGRLSVTARVAYFNTDDYDSRIYVYERDVLFSFSIPAYYNQGLRNYLLVQYKFNRHIDAWFRIARSRLYDQDTYGSDLDLINAPHRTDAKLQVRYQF
ncbi:MAG: helix-hairpin-helix domain-containing protein [Spirosomataceae bacterium]